MRPHKGSSRSVYFQLAPRTTNKGNTARIHASPTGLKFVLSIVFLDSLVSRNLRLGSRLYCPRPTSSIHHSDKFIIKGTRSRYSRLTIMAIAIKKNNGNHLRRVTEQTVNAKKKKRKTRKKITSHFSRESLTDFHRRIVCSVVIGRI